MKTMSMTAAIVKVNAAYGKPIRQSRTSYVAYVPYDITNDRSPSTEVRADGYWKTMATLKVSKAIDALVLMGYQAIDVDYDVEKLAIAGHSLREIVKQLSK